ncbi:MAG: hypothetical protein KAS32_12615 [Candidatus Peribacteraceae bacterium]|nr:hypothetical protein [Candidatus Peribacteraceae bacterium]
MLNLIINHWDKVLIILFAGLSALFAGLSAWLSYLAYARDKASIRVKINWAMIGMTNGEGIAGISFTAVNHGRRPVIIESMHILLKDQRAFFLPERSPIIAHQSDRLPKTLGEGESISMLFYAPPLIAELENEGLIAQYFCFKDTTGNTYRRKVKRNLLKNRD